MRIFLDRIEQRRQLANFMSYANTHKILRVYGKEDVGKTAFLRYAASEIGEKALIWSSNIPIFRCSVQNTTPLNLIAEFLSSLSQDYRFKKAFNISRFDKSLAGQRLAAFVASVAKDFSLNETSEHLELFISHLSKGTLPSVVGDLVIRTSEWTLLRDYCVQTLREIDSDTIYFIIDDIDQADQESLKILFSAIHTLDDYKIKLICSLTCGTAFPEHELMDDFFEGNLLDIKLGTLTEREFCQAIGELKAGIAIDIIHSLHKIVGGSVSQLQKVARMSDFEIENLVNTNVGFLEDTRDFYDYDGPRLTSSEFDKLTELFVSRLAINKDIPFTLCIAIDDKLLIDPYEKFSEAYQLDKLLEPLYKGGYLTKMQGYLFFESRLIKWLRYYFSKAGSYEETLQKIGNRIDKKFGKSIIYTKKLLLLQDILIQTDPNTYLAHANNAIKEEKCVLNQIFLEKICETLNLLFDKETLREKCSQDLLTEVVSKSILVADSLSMFKISSALFSSMDFSQFKLSVILAGVRGVREVGEIREWNKNQMVKLKTVLRRKAISVKDKLECYTIMSSIFEHRGEYSEIKKAYSNGDAIRNALEINNPIRIKYELNRGLSQFHGDIISETKSLGPIIRSITLDSDEKEVLLAIQTNHLGMGYFYNNDYVSALTCFEECFNYTKSLGRRTETPLNNIGACHLLLNNPESAHDALSKAKNLIALPKYQEQTIILNFSLAIFMLGMPQKAIEIARPFANETNFSPDPSLPNKFSINLAYYLMHQGDWIEANKFYQSPATFNYRFKKDIQQKTFSKMQHFTAVKAGYISSSKLMDYDFLLENLTEGCQFEKPFTVDINSFYVF